MKLSRLLKRRKYRSHRRRIDLFAGQPNIALEQFPSRDDHASSTHPDVKTTQRRHEPASVKEAFEAFKKSCQEAEKERY